MLAALRTPGPGRQAGLCPPRGYDLRAVCRL